MDNLNNQNDVEMGGDSKKPALDIAALSTLPQGATSFNEDAKLIPTLNASASISSISSGGSVDYDPDAMADSPVAKQGNSSPKNFGNVKDMDRMDSVLTDLLSSGGAKQQRQGRSVQAMKGLLAPSAGSAASSSPAPSSTKNAGTPQSPGAATPSSSTGAGSESFLHEEREMSIDANAFTEGVKDDMDFVAKFAALDNSCQQQVHAAEAAEAEMKGRTKYHEQRLSEHAQAVRMNTKALLEMESICEGTAETAEEVQEDYDTQQYLQEMLLNGFFGEDPEGEDNGDPFRNGGITAQKNAQKECQTKQVVEDAWDEGREETTTIPQKLEENDPVTMCGKVHAHIDGLIVIAGTKNSRALDLQSIMCLHDKHVLGVICDTFGSVFEPHYLVFPTSVQANKSEIADKYPIGMEVYYANTKSRFAVDEDGIPIIREDDEPLDPGSEDEVSEED